jgi:tRNA pseudouridine55 synthase
MRHFTHLDRRNDAPTFAPTDGIINLSKPTGITSTKALYRVRSLTGVRKSGHAGTLDPAADGVLLICQGRATKLVERLMDLPKVYRATARLDVTSESFDSDRPLIEVPVANSPGEAVVADALSAFEGEIEQIPPRISAIKLNGVPAYKTVGRKDAAPLRPKQVRIYWTALNAFDWPTIDFTVACGRGTYIRALIRDLGVRLGTGGCLTSLTRLAVGPFTVGNAVSLDGIAAATYVADCLTPINTILDRLAEPIEAPARDHNFHQLPSADSDPSSPAP